MTVLANILETLPLTDVRLESYSRRGEPRRLDGKDLVRAVARCRRLLRDGRYQGSEFGERRAFGLLFKSEETLEFVVLALAAIAERFTIVPLFPNWAPETQRQYLETYGIRSLAVAGGFAAAARELQKGILDEVFEVDLDSLCEEPSTSEDVQPFPRDLPLDHACAFIFTSGTSGKLAKLTEITRGNLEAAIENIRSLEFLHPGMTLHSPLSMSHIFAFVVVFGFLAVKPRRILFSDVQYLTRLPQARTGKVDGLILVPLVLHRLRSGFYEKLVTDFRANDVPPEFQKLARIPLTVRRGLKRLLVQAEEAVVRLESAGRVGNRGWAAIQIARRLLGKRVRERIGSPDFVVVGGARPSPEAMAFLEVMGIRCLQGWGMTETTGPLAVCHPSDRYRGAFGTCGAPFSDTTATMEDGELIVGGPQIARGYLEPDGRFVPFNGIKRTGDYAEFDGAGRVRILGKASDRITTENGLNYNPVPFEERLLEMDLEGHHFLDAAVVVGEGQSRLGVVFFPREAIAASTGGDSAKPAEEIREGLQQLLREFNATAVVDERLEVWCIAPKSLRETGIIGPSGKLVRRLAEEKFAAMFPSVVGTS